jgi:benzoylformate decarboxylase
MQALRAEGVEYLFGLPGSTETRFMDALELRPEIKYILGLHESVPALIGAGYARTSGKVAVMNFHTFVGVGAAMNCLMDAARGGVPLLVTAGQSDNRTLMQEPGLSWDMATLGKTFAKWSAEVTYPQDIALAVRRAFKVALQPPTGPVFLSLPQNVMNDMVDFNYRPNAASRLSRRRPDAETVDYVAGLLAKAVHPIVFVGVGVDKYHALEEAVKLVETIGASAHTFMMGQDVVFPNTHRQFLGSFNAATPEGKRLLESSDLTLSIGMMPPPACRNVIHIDNDSSELAKNTPVIAALEGDIQLSLAELTACVRQRMSAQERQGARERADGIAKEKESLVKRWQAEADKVHGNNPISGHRLARELAAVLPPHSVVIDEVWSYQASLQQYLSFTERNAYMRGRGPSIGQGLPLAIGAKLGLPDRPVIALVGDGSAAWSCTALWTAVHYNVPVKYVILHNASYRLVAQNKVRQLGEETKGRYLGLNIDSPRIDYCQLAGSFGLPARRIQHPDELNAALRAIIEAPGPQLLEVPMEGGF